MNSIKHVYLQPSPFLLQLLIINCRRENTIGRIQGYPPRHGLSTDLSLESIMFLVAGGAGRQRPEGRQIGCHKLHDPI